MFLSFKIYWLLIFCTPKKIFSDLVNLIIFFEKLNKIKIIKKIKNVFFDKSFNIKKFINKTNIKVKNKCTANL